MSNHPVDPDREDTHAVFLALLDTLPIDQQEEWRQRWGRARTVERRRRDYDRQWDRSLATVQYGGQGGG